MSRRRWGWAAPPMLVLWFLTSLVGSGLAGCAANGAALGANGAGGSLQVVAGENFWGSIVAQLGGMRVSVKSVVTDPNADPHEYESSAADARAFATARYVVLNGAGYDSWAQKLLDANPVDGRKVLTVATLLNKRAGDNPHFWYNPDYVERVVSRVTADLTSLDPAGASYYAQRRAAFETALKPYHDRIAAIRTSFAGRQVGSTESIFVYMASALGLNLISPPEFMQAISEGNDPSVSAVAQFQAQITQRHISVLVYNTQTATSVTTNLLQLAAQSHILVVGISETIQPPNQSFEDWQSSQLARLQQALQRASEQTP
ncbi:MAG: metal ABC transporter solute-binding protein, Zn/Mn family [Ktedonobacterales bacterium]